VSMECYTSLASSQVAGIDYDQVKGARMKFRDLRPSHRLLGRASAMDCIWHGPDGQNVVLTEFLPESLGT